MSGMPTPRVFLFLMGPSTPFWRELSLAFEAAGHRTVKVCFSLGDWLYWRRRGAQHFRGRLAQWPDFLAELIAREGVTDILLYADQQPYHRAASAVARAKGIPVVSIENGYLRPDWITVERDGMGVNSHFPNDPAIIRAIAAEVGEPDLKVRYRHGFWTEMFHEGAYQMMTYFWRVLYPFYRTGKYYDPLLELIVGIPKLVKLKASEADATRLVTDRLAGGDPFFVVALQLQGDYQIRSNSPYHHIREMIAEVIQSFAKHAPAGTRLIVKQHPHDNGWENWSHLVRHLARHWGIDERIDFIDGGDLGALLKQAKGCVMINSTVGLFSIRQGCPTKILGVAIYDMPGLTHQGALDSFWVAPEPVDTGLAQDFVRALAATIQVKGDFYDPEGRKAAIGAITRRVLENRVNEPGAFVDPPPRRVPVKR